MLFCSIWSLLALIRTPAKFTFGTISLVPQDGASRHINCSLGSCTLRMADTALARSFHRAGKGSQGEL